MMTAGFIHFDCLCGLDIYFFGDMASGEPPFEAIETFRARVGNHKHAIYTSNDETIVPCPCCETMIQLPTAQVAAMLGKVSLATSNVGMDYRPTAKMSQKYHPNKQSDGHNRYLLGLN